MMLNQASLKDQILKVVAQKPGCQLDEVATSCPDFQWDQVFLKVDQMSREGEVKLTQEVPGHLSVWLPLKQPETRPSQEINEREEPR